jgi:hypothetical protein
MAMLFSKQWKRMQNKGGTAMVTEKQLKVAKEAGRRTGKKAAGQDMRRVKEAGRKAGEKAAKEKGNG